MASTLDGKLVVAISSRALFDFEEENLVFEQSDDRAYMDLQLQRLETPAKPGVAFSLVKKLLSFNQADASRVEVSLSAALWFGHSARQLHPWSATVALFEAAQCQFVFVHPLERCTRSFGRRCACRTGLPAFSTCLRGPPS